MFRKSNTTVDHTIAFGDHVPAIELRRLQELSTPITVPAGTVLLREGTVGREALLVACGQLLVERGGEPVAVVEPGGVVGEQAVLLGGPRNATVRAATDVEVLAMNPQEFNMVLEDCPTLARGILLDAVVHASHSP
jgi:CRP-like cAMP-binding protein